MENVDLTQFDELLDMCKVDGSGRHLVDQQSTEVRLNLYAFGKQGKLGDNNDPKPGMLELKEKKKWEAYNELKGMDKNEARKQFIILAKQVLGK